MAHGRASTRGEGDKERVALRVDLEAVPFRERRAQHLALIGEEVRVPWRRSFQQPRRALDVGEQERDRASRDRLARVTRGISAVRNGQRTLQRYG